jgi:glycosyltransferase involved in cell wall biosynthesis
MKVSVIVPCYNFEHYIEQCLLSVVSQRTNFEFEILVRDDGSSDRSRDSINRICYRMGDSFNIRNFSETHEPGKNLGNSGLDNFRFMLSQAKGDYIAYLDGDDYWVDPYKLQCQIDFLENNKDYVMIFTGHWTKNHEGKYDPQDPGCWFGLPLNIFSDNEVKTKDLLSYNWVVYGRVYKNIPNLIKDWMVGLPILDWPMNYEMSKVGRIKYIDIPTGVYRIHNTSTFGNLSEDKRNIQVNDVRKIIREKHKECNPGYDVNEPIVGM